MQPLKRILNLEVSLHYQVVLNGEVKSFITKILSLPVRRSLGCCVGHVHTCAR